MLFGRPFVTEASITAQMAWISNPRARLSTYPRVLRAYVGPASASNQAATCLTASIRIAAARVPIGGYLSASLPECILVT